MVVLVAVFGSMGFFMSSVKKVTVSASRKSLIDDAAAKTVVTLTDVYQTGHEYADLRKFLDSMRKAKDHVAGFVQSHPNTSKVSHDFAVLLLSAETIQGLWMKVASGHKADFSSDDPNDKLMMDRILDKFPETRDIVVQKVGKDGQPGVYALPFRQTIAAFWTRYAALLDQVRSEIGVRTDPKLAQQSNSLYRPSSQLKNPGDYRTPFSPSHR